jgi:hypothetical protein
MAGEEARIAVARDELAEGGDRGAGRGPVHAAVDAGGVRRGARVITTRGEDRYEEEAAHGRTSADQ